MIILFDNKEHISVREAANKYKYSLDNIRRLIKKQKVKAFKHARKWYVHEPSLKTWIEHL